MASEYASFFSEVPEISRDTTLIFLRHGAVDRRYVENLTWFLGSRNIPHIVEVPEDREDEAKLLALGEAYVREKMEGGASDKYRLIPRDPTDNKSLNELFNCFFSKIVPTAFHYHSQSEDDYRMGRQSSSLLPHSRLPTVSDSGRKILYLSDPSQPKDNARKHSLLPSLRKGKVEAVSSLEELYAIMASPASSNITIYLTPKEAKKINNNLFLGRETAVFSDAEMARLRRPERVIYLGNYYPPMESISFDMKRRELGVDFIGMYNPEDFLDLEADENVGVIAENAKLARLAEGKGWHSVEVTDFNPLLGAKVAFLGSSENLGRYRDAISKYKFEDLGPISAEDVPRVNPSIIVVDKRDDKAVLTAIKNYIKVWQLDRLLSPPEVGRCSPPLPDAEEGKTKKIGNEEDHRKVTCENFLFDRLYRHPALPVPLPHPIDEKKAQEWIEAHPEKYREMARDFIRATHYVSFSEFYTNLRRSTLAALERIGERPFALLIAIEEGVLRKKSNYWVSQLVWDFFEEKKKFPADVTDSVASTARKYPQIRDFIIADDAAYSGTQMRATLDRQLENVLSEEEDEEGEAPTWDIHLVIPYISERAARVISPKKTWSNQFRLFLYSQVKMAKLSEILSPKIVERMSIEGFIDGDRWPYYFDHKIADRVSSYPDKYRWGRIAGTEESVVFLENCHTDGCFEGYYKNVF